MPATFVRASTSSPRPSTGPDGEPGSGREGAWGCVTARTVTDLVLHHQPQRGRSEQPQTDDQQPPAEDEAEHHDGRAGAHRDRPGAVRAEESQLARPFLDFRLWLVLRLHRQAPGGEVQVVADEEGQRNGEGERGGAGRVTGEVPVRDRGDGEERREEIEDERRGPHCVISWSGS